MRHKQRTAWFYPKVSKIELKGDIKTGAIIEFSIAISKFKDTGSHSVTIDFSKIKKAYPSGILPIIIFIEKLRNQGFSVEILLPTDFQLRKLFRSVNWAHFLAPDRYDKSESIHDRHLVTQKFEDEKSQKRVVDDFLDMIMRNISVTRDILSGFEWSLNEITDNVLNHAKSKEGGIVQASTFPKHRMIAFAVADGGIGIKKSMKKENPYLRTDIQALGEAIKENVTRKPSFGQGNGLVGTMRITTFSGGSFDITSGSGRLLIQGNNTSRKPLFKAQFPGTLVSGQIRVNKNFSITNALTFNEGKTPYSPIDAIETFYEKEDENCFIVKMKEESSGSGTRKSGFQLRKKVLNLMNANENYPVVIDWAGVPVISSSFADEMIGKLFLELGPTKYSAKIRNIGMEALVQNLIDQAITQRLKSKDE